MIAWAFVWTGIALLFHFTDSSDAAVWGALINAQLFLVGDRLLKPLLEHERRKERRTGWNYGYGQGVVDGRRGEYRPGAPPDGRSWTGVRP